MRTKKKASDLDSNVSISYENGQHRICQQVQQVCLSVIPCVVSVKRPLFIHADMMDFCSVEGKSLFDMMMERKRWSSGRERESHWRVRLKARLMMVLSAMDECRLRPS